MPAFLENKLKKEYGKNSKVPFMVMNKIGAMKGNKKTPKGKKMETKHDKKVHRGSARSAAAQLGY